MLAVKQYVLTRAAYPEWCWSEEENRRRLDMMKAVTAPCLREQDHRDWTWVLLVTREDPLLEERIGAAVKSFAHVRFLFWNTEPYKIDFKGVPIPKQRARLASMGYGTGLPNSFMRDNGFSVVEWRKVVDLGSLTTRLDDDDGIAPWFLGRVREVAEKHPSRRKVIEFPNGYRTWNGEYLPVPRKRNAWVSLKAAESSTEIVYDFLHGEAKGAINAGKEPSWLWTRHPDNLLPTYRLRGLPLDGRIRDTFPGVNWDLLERAQDSHG